MGKQVVDAAGDVAVVGPDEIGHVKFSIRGVAGCTSVSPFCTQMLATSTLSAVRLVLMTSASPGHLEDGDDRGVQSCPVQREECRRCCTSCTTSGWRKRVLAEVDQDPIHRIAAPGLALTCILAGDQDPVAVEHLQLGQGGGARQHRILLHPQAGPRARPGRAWSRYAPPGARPARSGDGQRRHPAAGRWRRPGADYPGNGVGPDSG
jgi:hypothetical protein